MLQEFLCGKLLKKDYEKAAAQQAERERQEKEEEKERRRLAAEERARRLEEEKQNKGRKKKAEKKPAEEEEKIPGAVKEASRVGMRQYARGRAYDPYRYSAEGPTAYPRRPVFQKKEDTRALEKESDELEQVALEQAADEAIVEAIREEQAGAAPEGLSETPSWRLLPMKPPIMTRRKPRLPMRKSRKSRKTRTRSNGSLPLVPS